MASNFSRSFTVLPGVLSGSWCTVVMSLDIWLSGFQSSLLLDLGVDCCPMV